MCVIQGQRREHKNNSICNGFQSMQLAIRTMGLCIVRQTLWLLLRGSLHKAGDYWALPSFPLFRKAESWFRQKNNSFEEKNKIQRDRAETMM